MDAKGKFLINFNSRKQPGDNQPALERGIISTTDARDDTFATKLWAKQGKNGQVYYSDVFEAVRRDAKGLARVQELAKVEAAIPSEDGPKLVDDTPVDLQPHLILMFRNPKRLDENDPRNAKMSAEEKKTDELPSGGPDGM